MTLKSVVLPAPLGPMSPLTAAGVDRQIDVLQRLDPAEAHGDLFDQELSQRTAPRARLVGGRLHRRRMVRAGSNWSGTVAVRPCRRFQKSVTSA